MGADPLGPNGLGDLQREGLNLRQELDRKFYDPLDPDHEPENINEAHWWVQPKWLKYLSLVVVVTAGSFWTYEVRFGNPFAHQRLMDVCFGALALVAALQLFFIFRAYWRMDI
jgi:hypothetical protein